MLLLLLLAQQGQQGRAHLEQRCGGVAARVPPHLVDLIQQQQRVARARLAQRLHQAACGSKGVCAGRRWGWAGKHAGCAAVARGLQACWLAPGSHNPRPSRLPPTPSPPTAHQPGAPHPPGMAPTHQPTHPAWRPRRCGGGLGSPPRRARLPGRCAGRVGPAPLQGAAAGAGACGAAWAAAAVAGHHAHSKGGRGHQPCLQASLGTHARPPAIERASDVLPTPGGPMKHRMGARASQPLGARREGGAVAGKACQLAGRQQRPRPAALRTQLLLPGWRLNTAHSIPCLLPPPHLRRCTATNCTIRSLTCAGGSPGARARAHTVGPSPCGPPPLPPS